MNEAKVDDGAPENAGRRRPGNFAARFLIAILRFGIGETC